MCHRRAGHRLVDLSLLLRHKLRPRLSGEPHWTRETRRTGEAWQSRFIRAAAIHRPPRNPASPRAAAAPAVATREEAFTPEFLRACHGLDQTSHPVLEKTLPHLPPAWPPMPRCIPVHLPAKHEVQPVSVCIYPASINLLFSAPCQTLPVRSLLSFTFPSTCHRKDDFFFIFEFGELF